MKSKILRTCLLLSLLTATLLVAGVVHAQGTPPAQGRGMMAQQQQMMAQMQAGQKKLDELVASMNSAKGPDKVDRIAAVVTEMVAQHTQMSGQMMSMQSGMMQMMMQGRQTPPAGTTGKN